MPIAFARIFSALLLACWVVGHAGPTYTKDIAMKSAKRTVPEVAPVSRDGIRYQVDFSGRNHGIPQTGGVISAVVEASGELLWRLVVYPVTFNPNKEEDTQEVFITALTLSPADNQLLVANEAGQHYVVHLADRTIHPSR
jgi:hypothetical protein